MLDETWHHRCRIGIFPACVSSIVPRDTLRIVYDYNDDVVVVVDGGEWRRRSRRYYAASFYVHPQSRYYYGYRMLLLHMRRRMWRVLRHDDGLGWNSCADAGR